MEENYETLEEELGQLRAEPPPQKPVQQIHRPEMYAARKIKEEMAPLQPHPEPKTVAKDPSFSQAASLHKTLPNQNPSETGTPWENVTLNRCLFVVITILVLTSGFHKLHEAVHGATGDMEEGALTARRHGAIRHRAPLTKLEPSLWDEMFWWLPDLDDEDDEDEEDEDNDRIKSKRRTAHAPSLLRNKPQPNKKIMKQREGKLKDRRAKIKDNELKGKRMRNKQGQRRAAANDEDEDEVYEEAVPVKKKLVKKN